MHRVEHDHSGVPWLASREGVVAVGAALVLMVFAALFITLIVVHWGFAPASLVAVLLLLGGLVWYVRTAHALAAPETLLLIGDDPELSVIAAFVTARRHPLLPSATDTAGPRILRVPDVATAAEKIGALRCREVVVEEAGVCPPGHLRDCRGHAVRVIPAREKLAQLFGRVRADLVARDPWYTAPSPVAPTSYTRGKRAVDLALALLVLPGCVLVGGLLGVLLRALGGASPLTRESRVGRDHRPFQLYRLRTQWPGSDAGVARPRAANRVGLFLRRTHLDQLPAVWNVIRGDLSLIGPRPESPENLARLEEAVPVAAARQRVRPGLASLAQVRFRYSDTLRDNLLALEYDLHYVKHRSATLDTRIFLRACWLALHDGLWTLGISVRAMSRLTRRQIADVRGRLPLRASTLASVALPRDAVAQAGRYQATLIAGAGAGGRQLVRELRRDHALGLWPVAFVDDDPRKIGTRIDGLPVLGDTQLLPHIAQREQIETIVIAIPSASEVTHKRIADLARQTQAQILTMPDIGTILRGGTALSLQTVPMTDVLGRPLVEPNVERCRAFLAGKRVLITGAAGSIGSELARQVAKAHPAALFGLDINESDLYDLANEITAQPGAVPMRSVVASVTEHERLAALLRQLRPEIIFHAAAYKHVPLMEDYPSQAVEVNTIGTYRLAQAAAAAGVERFVLVSTDKAVRPSSVMGATKRLAELGLRAVAAETGLSACAVRFGNVLGSRGSVIPLFEAQIARGGPLTITHPEMKRYFMTIPEAVGLIIEAGALGDEDAIYILDMGEEVAIRDLAERLIRLKGLRVGTDIDIVYTGMRPGEKLRESLSLDFETASPTPHEKIRIFHEASEAAKRSFMSEGVLQRLTAVLDASEPAVIRQAVMALVSAADGGVYTPLADAPDHRLMPVATITRTRNGHVPATPLSYGAADD